MNAHPMVTPLTALSPDAIAITYPPEAAALYRLVWDTTLAHLKGPPMLQQTHIVFGDEICPVTVDWFQAEQPGWLAVPQSASYRPNDLPANTGIPDAGYALEKCTYAIVPQHDARHDRGIDDLLLWMEDWQVASPARIASILETMKDAGWLELEAGIVSVTAEGAAQLGRAETAGFGGLSGHNLACWRVACDDHAEGTLSLAELAEKTQQFLSIDVRDVMPALDALVGGGHAARDAYALRDQLATHPPVVEGYSRVMDPELILPLDDPLRKRRVKLEVALTEGREQAWAYLPRAERVAIRLGNLVSQHSEEDLSRLIDDVHFDVRLRWLIGLGADAHPPGLDAATRAFLAWTVKRSDVDPA
jgi:hypothetical protein